MLQTLRQPRYAALTALMIVVALACVGAGSWQVARLKDKAAANADLRRNAHAPAVAVTEVLGLVGSGPHRPSDEVRFRSVRATGTFDGSHQGLVRQRSVEGENGYLALTPLRTADGTLLVVRGFIPRGDTTEAPPIPAPPTGPVTIVARAQPGETRNDAAGHAPGSQLESVNPRQQAARLGTPVFDGYAVIEPGQPGIAPLQEIPAPDLSNPAGGAVEPQHVAYVVQWYLFAILALAAPVAMARAERRHDLTDAEEFDDDIDDGPSGDAAAAPEQARAAKLADRYGRPIR